MNIVDLIFGKVPPEQPALIAGERAWSYGKLEEKSVEFAEWLRGCDGFPRSGAPRIGLACENGADYIVMALGILKAGACLVPLAEELTECEREEIIARTGLHGVVSGPNAAWQALAGGPLDCEADYAALGPAFIRFSSGTTGRSKGVVLSHRTLLERISAANEGLEIGPDDRVLWLLPMAHHFAVSIILYLYHGACTILSPSALAEDVLSAAEAHAATVIYASPFHFSLLAADGGSFAWPGLRMAVSSAAPLPAVTAESFAKRFGKPLVQGLGIIEVGLPVLNLNGAADAPAALGLPLPAYDVELRDDGGAALSDGVGELWVRGPGMFDAYLSPWRTREEICVGGWFATGDLAERDAEGRLFLRGRKKSVLNIGGMKVFPEEIEAVLNRHPAVKLSRVAGHEHPVMGTIPVADVVLHEAAGAAPRELADWCRASLSAFKVPARMRLVAELDTTASGKLRR